MTARRCVVGPPGLVWLAGLAGVFTLAACGSRTAPKTTLAAETTVVEETMITAAATTATTADVGDAAGVVAVSFDSPGADPRPLREVPVSIVEPVEMLRMRVSDLTYRGVVCGFTLAGTRPASPLTISLEGKIAAGMFRSGPVEVSWTADDAVTAAAPESNDGWSFSADAYPSRNGPGWVVSIGAVTGEGDNVIPSSVTCELRSVGGFVDANGPVGYWAGFATR